MLLLPLLAWLPVPDVVELKDGSRQVGEVRSRKDGVDLLTPLGAIRFAAADVVKVEPRAEQLPRYRAALDAAGKQVHALVTLSQWCLDHGLYPEAFDCVDRAAAAAPGDPLVAAAQEKLAADAILDGAIPISWPDVERRERLLERVAGRSPSRAFYARTLLLKAPAEELVPWLLAELRDLDTRVRIGAADVLGDVKSDAGLSKLIRASLIDESSAVRDHARASALKSGHPDLATPYLRALETDDSRLRERAYPALAELKDPRVVPALIAMLEPRPMPIVKGGGSPPALPRANIFIGEQRAYVQDFDVEIAQGAVIAKPVIGTIQSGVLLDVAVAGVQVISYVERVEVVRALRKVSGQDLGVDAAAWSSWWAGQAARPSESGAQPASPTR